MAQTLQIGLTHEEIAVLSNSIMLLFKVLPEVKIKVGSQDAATLIGILQNMKNKVELNGPPKIVIPT